MSFKTILVYLNLPKVYNPIDLFEFFKLTESPELEISFVCKYNIKRVDPSTFVRSGFVTWLTDVCKRINPDQVIFSHELSPLNQRNIVKRLNIPIVDLNDLILDIFARRARTYEGQLQVEYAQCIRMSTKLIRGWTHLERQKGGIGLRGPGEKQLETDRRLLKAHMMKIKTKIDKIQKHRYRNRKKRISNNIPLVCLVGYTNAGKSTIFKQLTDKDTYCEDKLFATLDTLQGRLRLPQFETIIVSDTVGFMNHLPKELLNAFKATLDELYAADVLIHIIDGQKDYSSEKKTVYSILKEMNLIDKPIIEVYNKSDQCHQPLPERLNVSALYGSGMELLKNAINDILVNLYEVETLAIPYNDENKLSEIRGNNDVYSVRECHDHWLVSLRWQSNKT